MGAPQFDPVILLLYILGGTATTLLHELGHALVPLAVGHEPVRVQLGPDTSRPLLAFRVGRLHLDIRRLWFWLGRAEWSAPLSPGQHAAAIALGPLVSLGICLLGLGLTAQGQKLGQVLAVFAGLQCVVTLWPTSYAPWLYPDRPLSDGAQLVQLWRGRNRRLLR